MFLPRHGSCGCTIHREKNGKFHFYEYTIYLWVSGGDLGQVQPFLNQESHHNIRNIKVIFFGFRIVLFENKITYYDLTMIFFRNFSLPLELFYPLLWGGIKKYSRVIQWFALTVLEVKMPIQNFSSSCCLEEIWYLPSFSKLVQILRSKKIDINIFIELFNISNPNTAY